MRIDYYINHKIFTSRNRVEIPRIGEEVILTVPKQGIDILYRVVAVVWHEEFGAKGEPVEYVAIDLMEITALKN